MRRARRSLTAALVVFLASTGLFSVSVFGVAKVARADVLTIDNHLTRDGWDPSEPALSPSTIGNGSFGRVFSTPVAGEVYAQPVVVGSTVIVATEHDRVYGIDTVTGAIQWSQTVGTSEPPGAIARNISFFLSPEIGVTSTPVVDPVTNTVYVMARTWDGANASSGKSMLHALDVSTGAERPGWPVQIAGTASNDPSSVFNAPWELQRAGLTLLNGWVYAGFASFGDEGPYKGWIAGVSTSTGAQTLWTDATGASSIGGGIWQAGSGLMSDGSGRLFLATGNGPAPDGDSVVRLDQQPDGTVTVGDRFTPFDPGVLEAQDLDLGSGGPVALPDSMGVAGHPHLLVVGGKQGITYLLDRDNLGGLAQGPGGTDASVAQSPLNGAVFGHAAVWPGDGGNFYMSQRGWLQAWKITTHAGTPTIGIVGNGKCCSRAMSPVVTSNGSTSGSALVWVIAADPSTGAAELQAYGAIAPGQSFTSALPLLFRAPVGVATKFSLPTFNNGRAYVGTYDGHLVGFGPNLATSSWLSSSAKPAVSGQRVTLTAIVAASGATPSGTVVFKDGGTTLGSGTLDGSGTATLTTSALAVGSHAITAGYGGAVGFRASTSAALAEVVGRAATVTSIGSSGSPSVFGRPVTFTASVSATAPGAGTPTGTVVFKDGATTLATVALDGSANAAFTTSSLSIATHPITAVYGGDTNFTGSMSNAVSQVANQIGTTTVIASSGSPSVFGQAVTFTASVSVVAPGTGTPTGSIVFNDGATTLATVALDGSANAAFMTSGLAVGSRTITATYGGDPSFATSASSGLAQQVSKAATVTGLSSQPAVFGESVTFTASVSVAGPGAGTPTGSVAFMDGATTLAASSVDGSGNATYTSSLSSLGSDSITAVYGDDASFAGSTSNAVEVVGRASTATGVSSSVSPSVFGQPVTFTASVSVVAPDTGTPTGTVVFNDGTTTLGSDSLDGSGTAALTISALAVGSHTITATYSGDASFAAGASRGLTQPVNGAATATVISSSGSPSVFGQPVTLTSSVSVLAPGSAVPTGTVVFNVGATTLGSGTLDGSGTATLTTSALAVGSNTLTATYSGDRFSAASTSSGLTQQVNAAATATGVTSSVSPSVSGQPVTFTASVSASAPGSGSPTGLVVFKDGAATLGSGTLDGTGTATLTTSALGVGWHAITAGYGGAVGFMASTSSALAEVVGKAATVTNIASSSSPSVFGQPVTFTASVSVTAPAAGTPTGTVVFKDGTTTLGSGTLDGSGKGTLATSVLAVASHAITATYSGGPSAAASASGGFTQQVNAAATATVMSSSGASVFGQSVTFTASVIALAPSTARPTGTVEFDEYDYENGTTELALATVDTSGSASFTTSALAAGGHTIMAVYAAGAAFAGSTSAVSQFVAATVPSLPTNASATAGSNAATVHWIAPASNGGSAINGYVVTPYVAGVAQSAHTFSTPSTTETLTALTNGTSYTFKVAGRNLIGTGSQSSPSPAVIVGSPAAPTAVKAISGSTTTSTGPLIVSFTAGANNGSAIATFTTTCTPSNGGGTGAMTGSASPLTVSGLTTGKTYTCTVKATNPRGAGSASVASLAVVVGSPAAPTAVSVVKVASGQLKVTFVPGSSNGNPIASYTSTCTSSNGGTTGAMTGSASPLTVSGLTAGMTYACTVTATNARGVGLPSAPSPSTTA
ncbi:MAG TPA: Ig-like domain repeat protein [Acidimicrobiia bacterium]